MKDQTLTDAVTVALSAIESIQIAAGEHDRDLAEAERRAAKAEQQAERDRRERQEAVSKVAGLEAKIVETRAAVAGEVETLRAEKEMLATRDREAREELGRLQLKELQRLGQGKQINPRGVTAGG
jgi:chromosome segregation ATPase